MTHQQSAESRRHQDWDVDDFSAKPREVLNAVKANAAQGDPDNIIKFMDDFCCKYENGTMNVGNRKGKILDELLLKHKPTNVIELGSYMGYSAVRIARLLKPGAKLYAIEIDPGCAKIVKDLVDFAGLSDKVEVIAGSSSDVIPVLGEKQGLKSIDFVFVDHMKSLYLSDARKIIDTGLLRKGSVFAADNVIFPGAPDYLDFIRKHPKFKSTLFEARLERLDIMDGIEESVYSG